MSVLSPDEALAFPGSLLSADGLVVASYDIEHLSGHAETYRPAASDSRIANANARRFRLDYDTATHVHIINGMGVTLGDSIIGLTAIAALRAKCPRVGVSIYRPSRALGYVEELYALANGIVVDERSILPWPIARFPAGHTLIDIGNHLFWRDFATEPMIDFFCDALGISPGEVAASGKANRWLTEVSLPVCPRPWHRKPYVLFCANASTPVRSIPESIRARLVDLIFQRYRLPVLGFGHVEHREYIDIRQQAKTTTAFLAWLKGARYVMTCDSAAVHVAAGFDVPTTAFFSTIPSDLRARHYPCCHAIDLDIPEIRGMQASNRERDIAAVKRRFEQLRLDEIALPAIRI